MSTPCLDLITDKDHAPSLAEISRYIGNPLFGALCRQMDADYQALCRIEYSGDKVLLGWNVKFKKAGRTLCTIYPRKGFFPMLLVIGRKEKERVEALLPSLSDAFREVYTGTQEGMGQRWLLFELREPSPLYEDALKVIRIRRQSK